MIGGTKGNKVLEYVSGAPNKAIVIEEEPNIFDYDQLTKYGYGVSDLKHRVLVAVFNLCKFLSHDFSCYPALGDADHEYGWTIGNVQTHGHGTSSTPRA